MWAFLIGGLLTASLCASRLSKFLRVCDGWAQRRVKIHRRTVARIAQYSKKWKGNSNLKAFFWTKKKFFKRNPSRPEFASKIADWFSSVIQSLQMHCRAFWNLGDISGVKTSQEIMIFTAKTKNYTHLAIQVKAFPRKPKKLRLFGPNKKA